MEVLIIFGNKIHGPIPKWLWNTSKGMAGEYKRIPGILTVNDLSSNKFSGEIPESIGNPNGLQALNLSNNALTGPIPTSLANLISKHQLHQSLNKVQQVNLIGKLY